jgi:uncharacterized protein YjbI with pentapeptide repeats
MANSQHLAILKQGAEVWNEWRMENLTVKPDLSDANLIGADLTGSNLRFANLTRAKLKDAKLSSASLRVADLTSVNLEGANLNRANLNRADLRDANLGVANLIDATLEGAVLNRADLWNANLSSAILINADLSGANLTRAKLRDANLTSAKLRDANLNAANLSSANLNAANLSSANLNAANLEGGELSSAILLSANLSNANLSFISAIKTNFQRAILTGVCIKDWHINADTNLQDVVCDYIYMRDEKDYENLRYIDRRPHDPTQNFAPGEFTKLFQKALSTVDLIFRNGINWEAFAYSFQQLQVKAGEADLSIQAIENKGDGDFVIRVNTPPEFDKAEVQRFVEATYQSTLNAIEDSYRQQLLLKDKEIESFKRESANMVEITKLLASRPITVEATAVSNADNQSKTTNYNLNNAKFGGGFAAEGGTQTGGTFNDYSTQQDLAAAAQDIQSLLNQLSQTYPSTTITEQATLATKAVEEIEKNPPLKARVVGALKAGGVEALKELIDHPAVAIVLAALEGWQKPE